MTSVKDVKASLGGVIDQGEGQLQQIEKVIETIDSQITLLRALTRGANPGRIGETIARIEKSRQSLIGAASLLREHSTAVRGYLEILG